MIRTRLACLAFSICGLQAAALTLDPWADAVVTYDPGAGAADGYTNAVVVVGAPTTMTSFGPVTMFNAPWETQNILSIGDGGNLTIRFDEPVVDDPRNPFGIDLLIFGNTGFFAEGPTYDSQHTNPAGLFGADGGRVEVSADGAVFIEVVGAIADGLFPAQPWLDAAATAPADLTRPVDPSLTVAAFDGLTIEAALALYGGSGGGAGVDITPTGLSSISYVRITHSGAGNVEIDAFADVTAIPEPGTLLLLALGLAVGSAQRTAASAQRTAAMRRVG